MNLTFPTNAGLLQGKGRCVKRGVSQLPPEQCLTPRVTRRPELPYLEDVHALHNYWSLKAQFSSQFLLKQKSKNCISFFLKLQSAII